MSQSSMLGRGVVLVFSAVFAVLFIGGGYWAGLRPLAETLYTAWSVRGWQPAPAQVLDAQLRKMADSEGGTTYQALTRYRYEYAGKPYEGQRIGLDAKGGADNIGDWQERWYRTLLQAQQQSQPVTAWVNPQAPEQALLDPSIRWLLLTLRLPFALVFTPIGLVAGVMFLRLLIGRAAPAEDVQPVSSIAKGHLGLWFFSLFWCGISFPMAALLWSDAYAPWWGKAFISVFILIGLGLVWAAAQQSRKVWLYHGLGMTALPARPKAGHPVEITLLLPPRAARQEHPDFAETLQLRLVHYRVDESASGSPERAVEMLDAETRRYPQADGGLRLVARFTLPDDAPADGAKRGGERVDWRVELWHARRLELAYGLPVQAAVVSWASSSPVEDRFDRRAKWTQATPITLPDAFADAASQPQERSPHPLFLPPGVVLNEGREAWSLEFSQTHWRWSAAFALLLLMAEWWANDRLQGGVVAWPHTLGSILFTCTLMAWALHAATRRWLLRVQDDGIVVLRCSWLWKSTALLPGDASQALVHKLFFTSGSGTSEQAYHAVYAKDAAGALLRLTPGLPGAESAQAVGHALARAWRDRQGAFSPGVERILPASYVRPGWGCLLLLVAAGVFAYGPHPLRWGKAPEPLRAGSSARVWSAADARLLDAQNAHDPVALGHALRDGANPDLLADTGSSMLMLAAHRGQMAHVELLLTAGAQVDLRQSLKDSERGDTALLRAFYGGHLEVAQRLVKAGASLQAHNRWDWGPVHMAAQSGCVPCLAWLKAHGQSLSEPALASRGETPAMLAASKGQLTVLEWLQREGVDLWACDSQGKNVLDWARFRKQADVEQWLLGHRPPWP